MIFRRPALFSHIFCARLQRLPPHSAQKDTWFDSGINLNAVSHPIMSHPKKTKVSPGLAAVWLPTKSASSTQYSKQPSLNSLVTFFRKRGEPQGGRLESKQAYSVLNTQNSSKAFNAPEGPPLPDPSPAAFLPPEKKINWMCSEKTSANDSSFQKIKNPLEKPMVLYITGSGNILTFLCTPYHQHCITSGFCLKQR